MNLEIYRTIPRADLACALRDSWSAETSNHDGWQPSDGPLGQCVPTALAVQAIRGGGIQRVIPNGHTESHYRNTDPAEDFTAGQYPAYVLFAPAPKSPDGDETQRLLQSPYNRSRFKILQTALVAELGRRNPCSE